MNNFFEQELRKLFGDGSIIESPHFTGSVCLGTLSRDLRVRAAFANPYVVNEFDSLQVTVLNRTEGIVDKITLGFLDILGKKKIPNNPNFRGGLAPHIWTYRGETEWYGYQPTAADYRKLRQAVGDYLEAFRERETVCDADGPRLVYICAPLRGDVEKNIEFARQKGREIIQEGDIPVCPHFIVPSDAGPEYFAQEQAVRETGLRLVEACQEVHVYGPEWTEGMWAEIRHAMDLGIEVKTDQQTIGRTQPHRQAARKGKGER